MSYILIILIAITFFIIYHAIRNKKGTYHSHWSTLVPSFTYSSKDFYEKLKNIVEGNNIEGLHTKIVTEKEGNLFSDSRLYLKVQWKEYHYYMCVAPFGDGLFLSWYLFHKQRKRELIVGSIPVIGTWLLQKIYPITMYRTDTASMYMSYCHDSMTQVLDDITKSTGFRLSENASKPIVRDLFKR